MDQGKKAEWPERKLIIDYGSMIIDQHNGLKAGDSTVQLCLKGTLVKYMDAVGLVSRPSWFMS